MVKYIDTYKGRVAVETMVDMDPNSVYVVDLDTVREILMDPDHMPGVWQHWLVHDEDAFIQQLKDRYENPSSR